MQQLDVGSFGGFGCCQVARVMLQALCLVDRKVKASWGNLSSKSHPKTLHKTLNKTS